MQKVIRAKCALLFFFAFASQAQTPDYLCGAPEKGALLTCPVSAKAAKHKGTTLLRVSVDPCGRALSVELEKSAGDPILDQAAIGAAKTWYYGPDGTFEGPVAGTTLMPGQFMLPVKFPPNPAAKVPDFQLQQWKRMQVNIAVLQDKQGRLPGYIADPEPLVPGTVTDLVAMLEVYGHRVPRAVEGVRIYEMNDGWLNVAWEVYDTGYEFSPAVVRTRLATDGRYGFWVTAGICESKEPEGCARFDEFLRSKQSQAPLEPPPPPPLEVLRKYGY